jgi:Bacterial Ig domain/Abnormal spindle-like microcephaly-assoc'd, ASPM-SPD-2-Hydin
MRSNNSKSVLVKSGLAASVLLLAGGAAFGQQQINLTAGPSSTTLPDGTTVPMWGYTCGAVVSGSTATCAALNANAGPSWSPVVITVPTGQGLTINLTNNLSFQPPAPAGGTAPAANTVPTSLVIVGQLGGGLGAPPTTTPSPPHGAQSTTWPIANTGATNVPPPQGPRVQSFATEVAAGATTALTWTAPRPGTYLIESGTHPSIQGPMGLYGILVVTAAPSGTTPGTAYGTAGTASAISYNAEIPLLLSEIDPIQNSAVNTAVNTGGFSETMVWSGQPGGCGNRSSATYNQCYPPAVNYTPLYYLFNGVGFNKTNAVASLLPAVPGTASNPITGNVLVRLVNAGLRMHVPSIVGSLTTPPIAPTGITPVPVGGFSLIAEDGNPLPGVSRVQSEVFMSAGKTYDVMVTAPAAGATALPVYDRELSLSGNAIARDAGMLAYISINGAGVPSATGLGAAVARPDTYNSVVSCTTAPCPAVVVSDPGKGLMANDTNVYGVQLLTAPTRGTLTLQSNGTFTYVPNAGTASDSFSYCANGSVTAGVCSSGVSATVTLGAATVEAASGISMSPVSYTSNGTFLNIKPPGILAVDKDGAGYPLTVNAASVTNSGCGSLSVDPNGGFNTYGNSGTSCTFTYKAQNSQGTLSANTATVTINFPTPSNLSVTVLDGKDRTTTISDYRWLIEEDMTMYVDPTKTTNGGPTAPLVPVLGVNFHTSHMRYVAQGCTGPLSCESGQTLLGVPAVCDVGNGNCRTTGTQQTPVNPSQVTLDPTKRYYISILPGDAANPFNNANNSNDCANGAANATNPAACGHGMGGAPIPAACTPVPPATTCTGAPAPVTVLVQPGPFPPGKLSVNVFEDDFPLNGEQDSGGGIDVLATNEPGLGGFNIVLVDNAGRFGDVTGQMTYDMFNQPLSNALAGQKDAATGLDACPIAKQATSDPTQQGITGMIVTCPKYESDGKTLSPLAGQAVVNNLMPGFFSVIATPGADRIARGEEWLQTNTLDGQKALDSFIRIGEPAYFQEYGPAGYHDSIGFANPAIINGRKAGVCGGTDPNVTGKNCTNTLTGKITGERLSRTPDERLYSSGSHDTYYWTQCYVSLGDPDGEDFAFAKCNPDGTFTLTGLPDGQWRLTVFDQWNDQIVDGLSTPVFLSAATNTTCNSGVGSSSTTCNLGDVAEQQWQADVYTRTFIDDNKDGVSQASEAGIPLINTTVRFRDGSLANNLGTDFNGIANFNEEFPYFAWMVVETDTTRYKTTGIHTVYDVGGPADGSPSCGVAGYPSCGTSTIGKNLANTWEPVPLPGNLSVPGAVYCADADCTGASIANGPVPSSTSNHSSGRIDPPWVTSEGWQGFIGQNNFIEFGKTPYVPGETGGIHGHVIYASTRPFDDPQMLVQTQWEPLIPNVTINLYQEGVAADGVTPTLKLVDTTQTSSWDDWAQGFRSDGVPNMNCPGQSTADLFFFTLYNQPNYLNLYNSQHGGPAQTPLPYNSQYKCYDGMHNWNQLQPAPYDGMYAFPSVTGINPTTGKPTGTNCGICVPNPDSTDSYRYGSPMLPAGKYVVEVVPPPGYEIVKEEDKNILIGDNFIAPATQEFGGLGNIFIMPDQASVASAYTAGGVGYNANNAQNPTQSFGASPNNQIVPGFVPEPVWPCVGATHVVPDYISLFPQSAEVAPFAGATRHLCDRKEVILADQSASIAKFYLYTSTHIAAKFTGIITDDFTSEFDPFAPTFGEKFSPANLPVSFKDWTGAEVSRVYSDWWGVFDGMTYSTWEVNPPNPTGYSPTMMVTCMNDSGPIPDPIHPGQMITDPLFNPYYSQFCYENPYMPGMTFYMDTPVVPTAAFVSAGYNNPDCSYPDLTPAISEVDGDGVGPWVSTFGHTITIKSLGDQTVNNYGYSGPSATKAPFNQKAVTRHYGFGSRPSNCPTTQECAAVTVAGVPLTNVSWSDTVITGTVPIDVRDHSTCTLQQQPQYGGSTAYCGELAIKAANGKQSVDTVTVTIGGKPPTRPAAGQTIQSALDGAAPGDLIIVPPGTYNELLIMWKPVRLQGVGAASTIINANTHPAGKLDPWRQKVDCLFGIALDGQPYTAGGGANPYDPTGAVGCPGTGWNYFSGGPNNPQVDRVPLEGIVGWDTTVNGNLAELLQEPSLLGAYEGAGITALGKGVNIPPGSTDVFGSGSEAGFPTGTTLLTAANCGKGTPGASGYVANPYPSNFQCNPSSIDGLTVSNASQGGGGIALHAWNHNMEIANNRVMNNAGTLSGGISIGQGEFPEAYLAPNSSIGNLAPGSCQDSPIANTQLPYCFNLHVNMHHNMITSNSSTGDELFSATPAGGGAVSFCTGADYYKFNYNWVCGNFSTGDGGGLAHLGFSYNGDIEHNTILFNQSINPTIPTNGGGLIVMGAAPDGSTLVNGVQVECGTVTDVDCVPGLSDGAGPGLVVNANLFIGNSADSGSGGALRFQAINGADVPRFPANPERWYSVQVTNNIFANNVAGWDGAGLSLEDALAINVINNTFVSNDTTASSGILFSTLGAPLASTQSPPPVTTTNGTSSLPQPAGLVTMQNSPQLTSSFTTGAIHCPANHYSPGSSATNGTCTKVSYPLLANNLFWQNRAFDIGVGALSAAYQQNIVTLYDAFTTTPAPSQPPTDATTANGNGAIITGGTGACVSPSSYWDIGVRGDTGPTNHSSGYALAPSYSVLTTIAGTGYDTSTLHNTASNPTVVSQYCNGSRVPPENGGLGYNVPPGISDATIPNPIFNLTPSATVDEGNNWINMSWGPLSLTNPTVTGTDGNYGGGAPLGNYALASGSPAIDYIPLVSTGGALAPKTDFFGNTRPQGAGYEVGAVEFSAPAAAIASVTGGPLAFGNVVVGTTSGTHTLTLHNTGTANLTGVTVTVTAPFSRPTGGAGGTCGATVAAAGTCTINVVFSPTATGPAAGTVTITANVPVAGSPVGLTGTGVAQVVSASLTPTSHNFGNATRGVGTLGAPTQVFVLTNTGNVTLTGITQGTISGTNSNDFPVVRLLSSCGPAGGGQLLGQTSLAPGAVCMVTVQFRPLTTDTTGPKGPATLSITDAAGTQTSTPLSGTAR